ncbi:MAG: hypothetical protein H0X43_10755 [Nitrosospira sp.]|nr:hypothetical protein [Nitrosospira sp.]
MTPVYIPNIRTTLLIISAYLFVFGYAHAALLPGSAIIPSSQTLSVDYTYQAGSGAQSAVLDFTTFNPAAGILLSTSISGSQTTQHTHLSGQLGSPSSVIFREDFTFDLSAYGIPNVTNDYDTAAAYLDPEGKFFPPSPAVMFFGVPTPETSTYSTTIPGFSLFNPNPAVGGPIGVSVNSQIISTNVADAKANVDTQIEITVEREIQTNKTLEEWKEVTKGLGLAGSILSTMISIIPATTANTLVAAATFWGNTALNWGPDDIQAYAMIATTATLIGGAVVLGVPITGLSIAALALGSLGLGLNYVAKDPPDSNYQVLAQPTQNPGFPDPATTDLFELATFDVTNKSLAAIDLLGVEIASVERYQGALQAGDFDWAAAQYQQFVNFKAPFASSIASLANSLDALGDLMEERLASYHIVEGDLEDRFRELISVGPPSRAYELIAASNSSNPTGFIMDLDKASQTVGQIDPAALFNVPLKDQFNRIVGQLREFEEIIEPTPLPEPNSSLLVLLGLVFLGYSRSISKRFRKKPIMY